MYVSSPLYPRASLQRVITAPTHSSTLFGTRYWMAALIFSMTMHLLVMHGLPWLNQATLQPAGTQGITASFKVLPNPTPAFEPPLPEIPPVSIIPIEPIKPKKVRKPKPVVPKVEPILQSAEIAQAEDFAMAEQTPDTEVMVEKVEPEPETVAEADPASETNPAPMTPSVNQSSNALPSTNTNTNAGSPVATQTSPARSQDNGLLDAYGRDLQRLCDRNKQYPMIAIRRGLEGAGSVLVQFDKDGDVLSISIEHSTGQKSLDDQAIKMVRKSLTALPLPRKLSGQLLTLSVPVAFRLDG